MRCCLILALTVFLIPAVTISAQQSHPSNLETKGDVYFIGMAQGEFGLKDMEYWFDHDPGVADMLVALDGGVGTVSYGALGIYWSKMVFLAESSHTVTSRGKPQVFRSRLRRSASSKGDRVNRRECWSCKRDSIDISWPRLRRQPTHAFRVVGHRVCKDRYKANHHANRGSGRTRGRRREPLIASLPEHLG